MAGSNGWISREQMIRGDKHKRKIALVHRGRTRAYGTKRGGYNDDGAETVHGYSETFQPAADADANFRPHHLLPINVPTCFPSGVPTP
jgi:hypothetical protein